MVAISIADELPARFRLDHNRTFNAGGRLNRPCMTRHRGRNHDQASDTEMTQKSHTVPSPKPAIPGTTGCRPNRFSDTESCDIKI